MIAKDHWKTEPDDHDYPAALDYLSLVMAEPIAAALVEQLKKAPLVIRKAKDLLRASDLAPLPETNVHVARDLDKLRQGKHLSPVLLVRGSTASGGRLLIADGYHRICASHHIDEDADIPCRLAASADGGPT